MKIAEVYRSVQGEGFLTGTESVFVRTSGCNLRCRFCDTPHASFKPQGTDLSVEEIVARAGEWDCRHVVVTGGEPMLFSEMIPLTKRLARLGRHITIETAGTLYLPAGCDLMSISPKLANSTPSPDHNARWHRRHESTRHAPEVIRRLLAEYEHQLKFVIDTPQDCEEVERYIEAFPGIDRERVLLMPQGTDAGELALRAEWLAPYCREHHLVFCPRKQIEWFGAVPGT